MDPEVKRLLINLAYSFNTVFLMVFMYVGVMWAGKRFRGSRSSESAIITEPSKPKRWLNTLPSGERSIWLAACRLQIDGIIQILKSATPDYHDRVSALESILNETELTIEDFGLNQWGLDCLVRQCALANARISIDNLRRKPGDSTWFRSLMCEVKRFNLSPTELGLTREEIMRLASYHAKADTD